MEDQNSSSPELNQETIKLNTLKIPNGKFDIYVQSEISHQIARSLCIIVRK